MKDPAALHNLLPLCVLALFLALTAALPLAAQSGGIGIWELPARQEAFMLRTEPSSDLERYSTLRSDFIRFGCAARHQLIEQPASSGTGGSNAARGNLICTLPGRYAPQIIVVASYTSRSGSGAGSTGWADAVLLPILYQALRAQERNLTWAFAELAGDDGERAFVDALHHGPAPLAIVVLDNVGMGASRFLADGPKGDLQVHHILEDQARRIAEVQGFARSGKDHRQLNVPGPSISAKAIADGLGEIPHVVLYSGAGPVITPAAFHQNFEFIAYYLCALDLKLNPLSDTGD